MQLSFDPNGSEFPPYPNGYWHAKTDDGGYDGDGATPLDAVAALVESLEAAFIRDAE